MSEEERCGEVGRFGFLGEQQRVVELELRRQLAAERRARGARRLDDDAARQARLRFVGAALEALVAEDLVRVVVVFDGMRRVARERPRDDALWERDDDRAVVLVRAVELET